jgi:hypothetical protein
MSLVVKNVLTRMWIRFLVKSQKKTILTELTRCENVKIG